MLNIITINVKCNLQNIRFRNIYTNMHTHIPKLPQFHTTHIASDHDVKADCICFVKCPKLSPVLCLEIFGKSAFKEKERKVSED